MAIVLHGAITLNRIASQTRTNVRTDAGVIEQPFQFTAETAKRWHSQTQAREVRRQLLELAWYSRQSGGIHVNSDEFEIDDGLYEINEVSAEVDQIQWGGAYIVRCTLSLTRIGGGPLGGNVVQRLQASSSLQANSYSITSTPVIAAPVGASSLDLLASWARSSEDGTMNMYTSGPLYALSGADYAKGEVKVYDTGGDTGTDATLWQRVFSPDHVFSNPGHIVIQNGLLRIQGITGTNKGSHRYFVWTGSAYTEVSDSTNGDYTFATSLVQTTYARLLFEALSPWRVRVEFRVIHGSVVFRKTITLERGKPLAQVELAVTSATVLLAGLVGGGRWVFTKGSPLSGGDMQRPAFDDSVETGDATLNAPEDNWAAMFTTKSSSTGTLGIVAWQSSGLNYVAKEGGGFYHGVNSATSLDLYIGGVKYDTSSAQLEAEAGTLTGGANLASTVAGASGAGNNQVQLDAGGAQVDIATNLASIGGSTVLMLFRIAFSSFAIPSEVNLIIRNSTASTNLALVQRFDSHAAATNTWYWQAVVGSGWNGTDTLVARALAVSASGSESIYVDQVIAVAIAGNVNAMQVDDVAAQALTENICWPLATRSSY